MITLSKCNIAKNLRFLTEGKRQKGRHRPLLSLLFVGLLAQTATAATDVGDGEGAKRQELTDDGEPLEAFTLSELAEMAGHVPKNKGLLDGAQQATEDEPGAQRVKKFQIFTNLKRTLQEFERIRFAKDHRCAQVTHKGNTYTNGVVFTDVGSSSFGVDILMTSDEGKAYQVSGNNSSKTNYKTCNQMEPDGVYESTSSAFLKATPESMAKQLLNSPKEEKNRSELQDAFKKRLCVFVLTGQTRQAFQAVKFKKAVIHHMKKLLRKLQVRNYIVYCPTGADEGKLECLSATLVSKICGLEKEKLKITRVMSSGGGSQQTSSPRSTVCFEGITPFRPILKFIKKQSKKEGKQEHISNMKDLLKDQPDGWIDIDNEEELKKLSELADKAYLDDFVDLIKNSGEIQEQLEIVREMFAAMNIKIEGVLCISGWANSARFTPKCLGGKFTEDFLGDVFTSFEDFRAKKFITKAEYIALLNEYGVRSIQYELDTPTTYLLCKWFVMQLECAKEGTCFWLQRMFENEIGELKAGVITGLYGVLTGQGGRRRLINLALAAAEEKRKRNVKQRFRGTR